MNADVEGALCRVCHCEAEDDRPLFHPCNCSGSIKYIHQDCLIEWFKISKKVKCELCGQKITFRRIYAPNAPAFLGVMDVARAIVPSVYQHVVQSIGMFTRFVLWLIALPIVAAALSYTASHYTMYGRVLNWAALLRVDDVWLGMSLGDLDSHGGDRLVAFFTSLPMTYLVGFWWYGIICLVFVLLYTIIFAYCIIFVGEFLKRVKASSKRRQVALRRRQILEQHRIVMREQVQRVERTLEDSSGEPEEAAPVGMLQRQLGRRWQREELNTAAEAASSDQLDDLRSAGGDNSASSVEAATSIREKKEPDADQGTGAAAAEISGIGSESNVEALDDCSILNGSKVERPAPPSDYDSVNISAAKTELVEETASLRQVHVGESTFGDDESSCSSGYTSFNVSRDNSSGGAVNFHCAGSERSEVNNCVHNLMQSSSALQSAAALSSDTTLSFQSSVAQGVNASSSSSSSSSPLSSSCVSSSISEVEADSLAPDASANPSILAPNGYSSSESRGNTPASKIDPLDNHVENFPPESKVQKRKHVYFLRIEITKRENYESGVSTSADCGAAAASSAAAAAAEEQNRRMNVHLDGTEAKQDSFICNSNECKNACFCIQPLSASFSPLGRWATENLMCSLPNVLHDVITTSPRFLRLSSCRSKSPKVTQNIVTALLSLDSGFSSGSLPLIAPKEILRPLRATLLPSSTGNTGGELSSGACRESEGDVIIAQKATKSTRKFYFAGSALPGDFVEASSSSRTIPSGEETTLNFDGFVVDIEIDESLVKYFLVENSQLQRAPSRAENEKISILKHLVALERSFPRAVKRSLTRFLKNKLSLSGKWKRVDHNVQDLILGRSVSQVEASLVQLLVAMQPDNFNSTCCENYCISACLRRSDRNFRNIYPTSRRIAAAESFLHRQRQVAAANNGTASLNDRIINQRSPGGGDRDLGDDVDDFDALLPALLPDEWELGVEIRQNLPVEAGQPGAAPINNQGDEQQPRRDRNDNQDILLRADENVVEIPIMINVAFPTMLGRWLLTVVLLAAFILVFYVLPCSVGRIILQHLGITRKIDALTETYLFPEHQTSPHLESLLQDIVAVFAPPAAPEQTFSPLHYSYGSTPIGAWLDTFFVTTTSGVAQGLSKGQFGPENATVTAVEVARSLVRMLFEWSVGIDIGLFFILGCLLVHVAITVEFSYLVELSAAVWRRVVRNIWHGVESVYRQVKITTLTCVSALLLPYLVGWIVDIVTLKTLNATLSDRMVMLREQPLLSLLVHILVGYLVWSHVGKLLLLVRTHVNGNLLTSLIPNARALQAMYIFYDQDPMRVQPDPAQANQEQAPPNVGGNPAPPVNPERQNGAHGVNELNAEGGGLGAIWNNALENADAGLAAAEEQLNGLFHLFHVNADMVANISVNIFLKQIILHFCYTIPIIFFGIFIPVRCGHIITLLSTTALRFDVNDHMVEIQLPVELFILHVLLPLVLEKAKYNALCEYFVKSFIKTTCSVLSLDGIYSENSLVNEQIRPHRPIVTEVNSSTNPDAEQSERIPGDQPDSRFQSLSSWLLLSSTTIWNRSRNFWYNTLIPLTPPWVRVALLLIFGMLGHSFVSSLVIYVPLSVGRLVLNSLRLNKYLNDIHCYAFGTMLAWATNATFRIVWRDATMHREMIQFWRTVLRWSRNFVVASVMGVLWCVFIPLCIGITGETMMVVPFRTPHNETPRYPLLQCWAIGIVMLTLWTRIVAYGVVGDDEVVLLGMDNENNRNAGEAWRRRFRIIARNGLENIDGSFIFFEVIKPLLTYIADTYLTSYFVSRTLGFLLFLSTFEQRTSLVRYSYGGIVLLTWLVRLLKLGSVQLTKLHNDIRDSKYLIGLELTNSASHNREAAV